jgi:WXG100 family type VII secretion target
MSCGGDWQNREDTVVADNRLKADLDIMSGVASKLASDYEQLNGSISSLRNQAAIHSADWSGEAKNAWTVAMTDVEGAWTRLNGVLDEITSNISASGAQYSNTDTTNASGYRNVQAGDITAALNR